MKIVKSPVQPGTARWDELVAQGIVKDGQRNWFLGDAALEIAPMGDDTANNGSAANLVAYADEIGVDAASLREYRRVAAAWPHDTRVSCTSWKVHAMLTGSPDLIEVDGPGVRVTVTRAHKLLGHSTDGRTGPESAPEAKAKQARTSLQDPAVLAGVISDPETMRRVLDQADPEQLASAVDNRSDAREALARRPLADQRVGESFRKVRDEHRAEHPTPERAPVDIDVYAERIARRVDNLFLPERHILTQQLDELIQYREHMGSAAQMKLTRAFSALAARVEGYREQLRAESPQTVTPDRDPDFALLELEGVEERVGDHE